ncbi:MAG: hypothetical protein ACLP9L_10785 [Thermoguttaceae bacterium]
MKYERQIVFVARWTARIIGTLLLVLIAIFVIGEGVPNPSILSHRENLLTVAMLTMIVGQIAAWKWEGIGGVLILSSYFLFAIMNHGIPFNIVFGPWLLTGLLFLGCAWMESKVAGSSSSTS